MLSLYKCMPIQIKLQNPEQRFPILMDKTHFMELHYADSEKLKLNIAIFKIQLCLFFYSAKIYIMTLLIHEKMEANRWLLVTINYGQF